MRTPATYPLSLFLSISLHTRHHTVPLQDGNGALSLEEFMSIPELEHNPLVKRVVETFDSDKSGEVDFMEFIKVGSLFGCNTVVTS